MAKKNVFQIFSEETPGIVLTYGEMAMPLIQEVAESL